MRIFNLKEWFNYLNTKDLESYEWNEYEVITKEKVKELGDDLVFVLMDRSDSISDALVYSQRQAKELGYL